MSPQSDYRAGEESLPEVVTTLANDPWVEQGTQEGQYCAVFRIHMFLGFPDPDPDPPVRGMDPDPHPDPHPNPDPLVRGMNQRIRIRIDIKMSWIRKTGIVTRLVISIYDLSNICFFAGISIP